MNIENKWLTTNIKDIAIDTSTPFNVTVNKYPYTKLPFLEACENVCQKIAALNKPIYVAYSGGMDSEFVINQFKLHNIPFTAITTLVRDNWIELQYARYYYYTNPEIPKVILRNIIDHSIFFDKFNKLVQKFNCAAPNAVQILECAEYVKEQGGILVIGDHLMGTKHNPIDGVIMAGTSEWDHYFDTIDDNLVIPFYYYDLPITESFVSNYNTMEFDYFKAYMYQGTNYRPKFVADYNRLAQTTEIFNAIKSTITPKSTHSVDFTKEHFLSMIE
jgi:hypothetical protein